MTRLDASQVEHEAVRPRALLEERTGNPAVSFAFPFGYHNRVVRDIVGKHFRAACTTELGQVPQRSAPLALERIEMHYFRTRYKFSLLSRE